jgi:hypothetical protein
VTSASRFLIGLVTCFASRNGIPAVARAALRRWEPDKPKFDRCASPHNWP